MASAGITLGAHALSAQSAARVLGANDRIRVGFIGVGNRGSQLLHSFMGQPDVEVAALCDVYEPYLTRDRSQVHPRYVRDLGTQIPRMGESFGSTVKRFRDYRRLLDEQDIDAVCVATPDHWHALQTVQAIEAGKDVYVEKPLTITVREGRLMVDAQTRSKQVVAVGLNRRGSSVYQELAREVPAGRIGQVTMARAFRINNMYPNGIGKHQAEAPPPGLDWDMWLGPRAERSYQYNIAPYKFRWWSDYSSQMGNWGVHFMDVIRWMMGETAPEAISAHGGNYAVDDDRTIPDTMHVTYEFASGALAAFEILEASSGELIQDGEVELRGTKGTLYASQDGYRIVPTTTGQFQTRERTTQSEINQQRHHAQVDGSRHDGTATLVRDFLDCVKSRSTPLCPLEEGHRSTCFAHLANIALATGQRLRWDPAKEQFTNSGAANELLHYDYRKPWRI
jgi:predicted dehydrogenase